MGLGNEEYVWWMGNGFGECGMTLGNGDWLWGMGNCVKGVSNEAEHIKLGFEFLLYSYLCVWK